MTDQELRAVVAAEKAQALSSFGSSDLSKQRARAMDYYLSDMSSDMPSQAGRSSAVSSDVADTIESIMPSLMEIFAAGDEIVKFNPVGPEDEEAAAQETDYVNHVFYQDNPGFLLLYTFFKDALLQKTGIFKFWWEVSDKKERETYEGQPTEVYEVLAGQDDVEVVEHTEYPAPPSVQAIPMVTAPSPTSPLRPAMNGAAGSGGAVLPVAPGLGTAPASMLHDFTLERTEKQGRARVVGVPPEEFLIARRARNIANAPYLAHRVRRTQSELIEMGYAKSLVETLPTSVGEWQDTEEALSRAKGLRTTDAATADIGDSTGAGDANQSMRLIDVVEHYIMVDFDGAGVAELRKVTTAGGSDTLLDNEPFDAMPFAVISPILLPHRVIGVAIADLVIDIQKIKTALYRETLDNAYLINNARTEISESHAGDYTIDDLLTNRPGGIVRTKMPGGLNPLITQPIGQSIFPMIEYIDAAKEARTGVAITQPGLDAQALQNQTATAANIASTAAQQRIKLIARIFAETGVKDMFLGLHRLILEHGRDEKARVLRLRNKWVTVDPSDWRERNDMTVTVGLGTGNKDQQLMHLQSILGMQVQAIQMQGGVTGPIVTLEKVYKTLSEITKNAGFRNPDDFWSDPTPQPGQPPMQPPAPPPNPAMIEVQGKLQIEQQRAQFDQQHQQAVAQADQQHQQMKAAAEHQREVDKTQAEQAREMARMQADNAAALRKAQLDAANAIEVERIKSATAIEVARINTMGGIEEGVRKAVVTALAGAHAAVGSGPDGEPGKPPPVTDLADAIARAHGHAVAPPPEPAAPQSKVRDIAFIRGPDGRMAGAQMVER
jgi:hypothetical protein